MQKGDRMSLDARQLEEMQREQNWRERLLLDEGLPDKAFDLIRDEDKAQIKKWGYQLHTKFEWLAFLTEEVGELSAAMAEYHFRDGKSENISKEATQVATLALKIAWLYSPNRR